MPVGVLPLAALLLWHRQLHLAVVAAAGAAKRDRSAANAAAAVLPDAAAFSVYECHISIIHRMIQVSLRAFLPLLCRLFRQSWCQLRSRWQSAGWQHSR